MPSTAPYTTDVLGKRVLTKWDPDPGTVATKVRAAFVYQVPEVDESGALVVGVIELGGHLLLGGIERHRLFDDEAAADAFLAEYRRSNSRTAPVVAYWPAGA